MKLSALASLPLMFAACALLSAACGGGPYPAPAGTALSEIEAFTIVPTTAHTTQDGFGTLLFGDVIAYNESTNEPLDGVQIEVMSNWSGMYVMPQSAIKLVDAPAAPEEVQNGTTAPSELCDTDADGLIDYDAEEWCSWWWDTETEQFYQFGGDYAMTPSNYQPTYMTTGTDNRGLCRFYLYVDSLPYNEGANAYSGVTFWVSIGVDAVIGEIEVAE
jgi:hypothetical protein